MLIRTLCPSCQFTHELSDKLVGETIDCRRCTVPFVVVECVEDPEPKTFGMESIFTSEVGIDETVSPSGAPAVNTAPRLIDGKHALVVPPPPAERWSAGKGKDDKSKNFRDFDHDSRALRKFLARDEGSDYSWLLVTGLVLMTLMLCTFQGLLGLLIIFVR